MTGENGTPETPEWTPEPRLCPPLDAALRDHMLTATPTAVFRPRVAAVEEHLIRGEN